MFSLPQEVKNILEKLQQAGFEAYAVGGCVRDLILGREPKDWDVCTNALPEQVQQIFPESFYENKFGTVSVSISNKQLTVNNGKENKFSAAVADGDFPLNNNRADFVEVTTYRIDALYSDKRHPDKISFTPNLKEDLARRDFTINAIALRLPSISLGTSRSGQASEIVDPFGGQDDLKNGIIRAVGEPDKRFSEDALRLMRAVRFVVELSSVKLVSQTDVKQSFSESKKIPPCATPKASARRAHLPLQREELAMRFVMEEKTEAAIKKNAGLLKFISGERVRDELVKIIMAPLAHEGILLLHELGLLQYIIPEFTKGFGVAQNKHHIYSIFEHGIFSLKFAVQKKSSLIVRLAALLHDVAKPQAKRGEGEDATFYNHDIMGNRIAARILERLHFDNDTISRVAHLIRHHMFVYDIGAVTAAGVRRLLARVGPENMEDLLALRVADRLGSGVPKAQPYRLRHFQYMVEKVQHDAISVKMLKINGHDLMEILKIKPGPKIGAILDVLLAEVIEDPKKNTKEFLAKRARQLNETDLTQLRQMAREQIDEKKEEDDKLIKGKYWVF